MDLSKSWDSARKFWDFPQLPTPKLIEEMSKDDPLVDRVKGELAFVQLDNDQIYFSRNNIRKRLDIKSDEDEQKCTEIILKHELGHYMLIPFDIKSALLLIHSSSNALKKTIFKGEEYQEAAEKIMEVAQTLTNLFTDTIDNTFLHNRGEKVEFIYQRLRAKDSAETQARDIYSGILERLWSCKIRPNNTLSPEHKKTVDEIVEMLSEDTFMSSTWREKNERFTELFSKHVDPNVAKSLNVFENQSNGELSAYLNRIRRAKGSDKESLKRSLEEKIRGLAKNIMKNPKDAKAMREYVDLIGGLRITEDYAEANMWFYRDIASSYSVKFVPIRMQAGDSVPFSPKKWTSSDPITDLDIAYSISTSGKIIPEVTTYQWDYVTESGSSEREDVPDLYILMDSSQSMLDPTENVSPAVIGAIVARQSAHNRGARVASGNFSGRAIFEKETYDGTIIDKNICIYQCGETTMPGAEISDWVINPHKPKQFLIITDTGFQNFENGFLYLKNAVTQNPKNRIALFKIKSRGGQESPSVVEKLKSIGCEIFEVDSPDSLLNMVIGKSVEVYGK